MTKRHAIPGDQFDALATNTDTPEAVKTLRLGQYSRRVLLIRALVDRVARVQPLPEVDRAFQVLTRAQQTAPDAVVDVLLHPHVGTWATETLRTVRASTGGTAVVERLPQHLGAIAASVAIKAKIDFSVELPVHSGRAFLPALGCAEIGGPDTAGLGVVEHRAGVTRIVYGPVRLSLPRNLNRDAGGWRATRRLQTIAQGYRLEVTLDDADPYREYPGLTPAGRLPADVVRRWQDRLDEAWALLVRHHRPFARTIQAGLASVVPLADASPGGVSATSADAFGAAAIALPDQAMDLAVALVHEFQHSKLSALLDLVRLHEPCESLYYAPWRADPRPIEGLLQGCFAHMAIGAFWRAQRRVSVGADVAIADFEYGRWREQTLKTVQVLAASDRITPAGRRFVYGMLRTLGGWQSEPIPAAACRAARLVADDHWLTWRLRNLRAEPEWVNDLVRAWRAGQPCPAGEPPSARLVRGVFSPSDDTRVRLLRRRLREPDRQLAGLTTTSTSARRADFSLVCGDYATAAEGYRSEIEAGATEIAVWSGYALARSQLGGSPPALLRSPELVLAFHRAMQAETGDVTDPDVIAAWLAPCQRSGGSISNSARSPAMAESVSG